jgi:hypothetical protein
MARTHRRLLISTALALVFVGGLAGAAQASCVENPATPFVNCNPGGAIIASNSLNGALTFAPATTTTVQATDFDTQIVGKLDGGVILFDQSFDAAFDTPTVQNGVKLAITAITTAGGPGSSSPVRRWSPMS